MLNSTRENISKEGNENINDYILDLENSDEEDLEEKEKATKRLGAEKTLESILDIDSKNPSP